MRSWFVVNDVLCYSRTFHISKKSVVECSHLALSSLALMLRVSTYFCFLWRNFWLPLLDEVLCTLVWQLKLTIADLLASYADWCWISGDLYTEKLLLELSIHIHIYIEYRYPCMWWCAMQVPILMHCVLLQDMLNEPSFLVLLSSGFSRSLLSKTSEWVAHYCW